MSRAPLTLLALGFGLALSAQAPEKELPKFQGGDLQKYWSDACARCHGVNGNGRDASGKPLPDAGFDFTDARRPTGRRMPTGCR